MRVSGGSQLSPPGERGHASHHSVKGAARPPRPDPSPGQLMKSRLLPGAGAGAQRGVRKWERAHSSGGPTGMGLGCICPSSIRAPGWEPGSRRQASCCHCRLAAEVPGGPAGSGPTAHRGKAGVLCFGTSLCFLPPRMGPSPSPPGGATPKPDFPWSCRPQVPSQRGHPQGFQDRSGWLSKQCCRLPGTPAGPSAIGFRKTAPVGLPPAPAQPPGPMPVAGRPSASDLPGCY